MSPPGLALLAILGLGLTACGPSAGDIAEARARHVAELDGFSVRQEPVPGTTRLEQDVALDLRVRREDSRGELPEGWRGITLDVDQVDAAGKSRRHWRVWVDTAGLGPGRERRSEPVLEDVDFAPGDGFRVEVRQSVSGAERAGYREYRKDGETGSSATGSGPTS